VLTCPNLFLSALLVTENVTPKFCHVTLPEEVQTPQQNNELSYFSLLWRSLHEDSEHICCIPFNQKVYLHKDHIFIVFLSKKYEVMRKIGFIAQRILIIDPRCRSVCNFTLYPLFLL
jgi:hypothetical protein